MIVEGADGHHGGLTPVATVEDLRALMGSGFVRSDAAELWRILDRAGLLVLADDGVSVVPMGADEWYAWCRRAQISARRQRREAGSASLDF